MLENKIASPFKTLLFKLKSSKLAKILYLTFILTSLFVSVIVVQQRQEIRKKAQESQDQITDTNKEILISSNELAIKLKKESKDKIKAGNPEDTGALSLNKSFKNFKVKRFEKIFKQGKNQAGSDLDLWYRVELDTENKKVKPEDKETENLKKLISEISKDENVDVVEPNYIFNLFQSSTPSPTPTPSVTRLLSPVGGETWYRGETHIISWVRGSGENPSTASLHCYINDQNGNPINVGAIEYNLPASSADPSNPNTYSWTIPTSGSASCPPPSNPGTMIEVVLWDANGNAISSARSGVLTITQPPTPTPDIARIVSPVGGETWYRGETHTISWIRGSGDTNASSAGLFCYTTDANNNPQYIGAIEYNLPTSSTNPLSPNTYTWQIPTSGPLSCPPNNPPTIIEVGLYDASGNSVTTARSGVLTIYPQSYTLTPTPSFLTPNDPYYSSSNSWGQGYEDLWGLKKIDTSHSWFKTTGSKNVVVAVIDTGMDYNHEDLSGVVWVNSDEIPGNNIDDDNNGYIDDVNGWDYATLHWPTFGDNDPMDDNGHGTHVSGTIGAVGNNAKGVVGINWKVTIMPIKVLDLQGFGNSIWIAQGLKYAADNGAKISSNSYGGLGKSFLIRDALKYEYDKGMTIVAAAGNSRDDALNYLPASSDYVITVGASDVNDNLANFSNYGEKIDVVAPGVDTLSTRASQDQICGSKMVGTNYCRLSGTSMATPHVSGLAALILSNNPNLTNEEIRQIIKLGADDVGTIGKDFSFGFGRINTAKSINLSSEKPLAPIITYPKSGSEITGQRTLVIKGGITGPNFKSYKIEYAKYDYKLIPYQGGYLVADFRRPANWETAGPYTTLPTDENLLSFDLTQRESGFYSFRLIATDNQGRNYYYQVTDVRVDKEQLTGWPKDFYCPDWNGCNNISPAISDINSDGQKEIVIVESVYNNENLPNAIKLHVFNKNGTYLTGFPISFNVETDFIHYPSPLAFANNPVSIDDIDNDGKKEIILTVLNRSYYREFIYVIRSDGRIQTGWPKLFEDVTGYHGEGHIPATADLDNDGRKEIVLIDGFNILQALKSDGSNLTGFPKTPLPKPSDPTEFTLSNSYVGQLSIFDMDNDGKKEIAVGRPSYMYLLDNQGNVLPGWPYKAPFVNNYPVNFYSTPSFGDIDGDGKAELIAVATHGTASGLGCGKYPITCQSLIYAWKKDGTLLSGWPKNEGLMYDWPNVYGPSLADMDNDGKDEIVTGLGKLAIYDLEGKKNLNSEPITNFQPSLSDINGDGKLEMTAGTMWNNIFSIIKQDGTNYWKTTLFNVPLGGGVIADMDNNGLMELSLASAEGEFYNFSSKFRVYFWEIPNLVSSNIPRFEWPMFGRDPSLSGKVPKYPNVLNSTVVKTKLLRNYTVRFSWDSVAPKNSSLYIFKGSCRSGTYGPGDLLWSQPTGIQTSYVYRPTNIKYGNIYCGQIWIDFNNNIPASNTSSVTISK